MDREIMLALSLFLSAILFYHAEINRATGTAAGTSINRNVNRAIMPAKETRPLDAVTLPERIMFRKCDGVERVIRERSRKLRRVMRAIIL